jgi:hypothetical protein
VQNRRIGDVSTSIDITEKERFSTFPKNIFANQWPVYRITAASERTDKP